MPAVNTEGYHLASPRFQTAQEVMDAARQVQRLRDLQYRQPKPVPVVVPEPVQLAPPAFFPRFVEPDWLSMISWPAEILGHENIPPSIKSIQQAFCEAYGDMTMRDMVSPRRTRGICVPRQLAMALAKHLTIRSLPEIGRMFGGRDHTTVLHATRKMVPVMAATIEEVGKGAPLSVWVDVAIKNFKLMKVKV